MMIRVGVQGSFEQAEAQRGDMSKKVEQKALILRKGIFVSVVDFVNQLTDRTSVASSAGTHESGVAETAEKNAPINEFLYFWEQESSRTCGD